MTTRTHPAHRSMRPTLDGLRDVVVRWPLTTFAIVTLAISWPFGLLPHGPSLAALLVTAFLEGRSGVRSLLARTIIWRVGLRWYAVALLGPVVLMATVVLVHVAGGGQVVAGSRMFDWPMLGQLFALQVLFAGPWEELGWRGFALPRLLRRTSPLLASLALGTFWAVWHVPMFVSGAVPWVNALFVVLVSIPFTAVFVRTRGSVLIAFLMHGAINAAGGVGVALFPAEDRPRLYWLLVIVTTVVAAVVVGLQARWWTRRGPDPDEAEQRELVGAGGVVAAGPTDPALH